MSDLKLSDGRELDIDLNKITIKEWRALLNPEQKEEEEYRILGKVVGLKAKDIENLPYMDFRLLGNRVAEKASAPLSDPNLSSESSSQSQKDEKSPSD
jgi:hypothetical protein